MSRVTPWLTALTIAGFATLATAQPAPTPTSPNPQAPPQQLQTQPADMTQPASGSARGHLDQAKQALDSIPKDAVTGRNASKIAEVRRHLTALDKAYTESGSATAGAAGSRARSGAKGNWATHVTAIDKALSDLLESSTSAPAPSEPPAAAATAGKSGELSADVRAKLAEVRQHITAFASAASGAASTSASTPTTRGTPSAPAPSDPQTAPPATPPTAPPTEPTSPPTATSTSPTSSQTMAGAQAGERDEAAARQHLSEARRVLSEITTMPQAAQLQGEARTQISQLISNFNSLLTAKEDWQSKCASVEQNVNALLGETTGAGVSGTAGTTATTPQPTGTAGTTAAADATTTLDPAIRAKLEEFRRHMAAFKAAAGGSASGPASPSAPESTSTTGATAPTVTTGSTAPTSATPTTGATTSPSSSSSSQMAATSGQSPDPLAQLDLLEQALQGANCDPARLQQAKSYINNLRQALRKP